MELLSRKTKSRKCKAPVETPDEEVKTRKLPGFFLQHKAWILLLLLLTVVALVLFRGNQSAGGKAPISKGKRSISFFSANPENEPIPVVDTFSLESLHHALRTFHQNFSTSSFKIPTNNNVPMFASKNQRGRRRTFGCMRDTCRGLEIEDLLDRGFSRLFRSALKPPASNESSSSPLSYRSNLKYNKLDLILLDTTQLNHIKSNAEQTIFKKFKRDSFVIAMEGGDAIGGNKGVQLRRKTQFVQKFHCDYDSLGIQPAQYRLYVKRECSALLASEKSFLLKPEAGSQGDGITFHLHSKEVLEKRPEFFPCRDVENLKAPSRFLAQEYIAKPLLVKGSKFDLRVYLFVLTSSPEVSNVFSLWYHAGYLRRSLTPYQPVSHDRKAYLTNTHFQSSRANFNMSDHIWTLDQLQQALQSKNWNRFAFVPTVLEPHMKEVARFVFESARDKIQSSRTRANQIIGLDFMLDEDLALHFIEANGYPGFTWSINFDSRKMVEEMFDAMLEHHEAPSKVRFLVPGDWFGGFQLIHTDEQGAKQYNPCQRMGDNMLLTRAVQSIVNPLSSAPPSLPLPLDESVPDIEVENPFALLLVRATSSCKDYVISAFALNQQCNEFQRKSEGIVSVHATSTTRRPILYPNASSVPCAHVLVGQWLGAPSVSIPLERVAYPGGKSPLRTFSFEDDREDQQFDFVPQATDPVHIRARQVLGLFENTQRVVFHVKWFFVVLRNPLLVLSHAGYAFSVRRCRCATKQRAEYDTHCVEEHTLPLELFQFMLSKENMVTQHYVVSILEPTVRRLLVHLVMGETTEFPRNFTGLGEVDFHIDAKSFRPRILGIRKTNRNPASVFQREALKPIEELERHVRHVHANRSLFFARAKYGDAFGQFRVVVNELETWRSPSTTVSLSTCAHFPAFPSLQDLTFEVDNFGPKRDKAIQRDLDKRISKRWMVCRVKKSPELKLKCMRALLSERYRIIVKQNRLLSNEEQWIQNTMQNLLDHKSTKKKDDDEDEDDSA